MSAEDHHGDGSGIDSRPLMPSAARLAAELSAASSSSALSSERPAANPNHPSRRQNSDSAGQGLTALGLPPLAMTADEAEGPLEVQSSRLSAHPAHGVPGASAAQHQGREASGGSSSKAVQLASEFTVSDEVPPGYLDPSGIEFRLSSSSDDGHQNPRATTPEPQGIMASLTAGAESGKAVESPELRAASYEIAASLRGRTQSDKVIESHRTSSSDPLGIAASLRGITQSGKALDMSEVILPAIEYQNTKPSNGADMLLRETTNAVGKASFSSLLYTSRPFTMTLIKRQSRFMFAIGAAFMAFSSLTQLMGNIDGLKWARNERYCKIIITDHGETFKGVKAAGLVKDGWPVQSNSLIGADSEFGSLREIRLEALSPSPSWNGIYFDSNDREVDSLNLEVYASEVDGELEWTKIATLSHLATPAISDDILAYDLRFQRKYIGILWFEWNNGWVFRDGVGAVAMAVISICARHPNVAKSAFSALVFIACMCGVRQLYYGFLAPTHPLTNITVSVAYLGLLGMTACMWVERWAKTCIVSCCFTICVHIAAETVVEKQGTDMISGLLFAIFIGVLPICYVGFVMFLRSRSATKSLQLLEADSQRYDAAFRTIIENELPSLQSLKRKVAGEEALLDHNKARTRQYQRQLQTMPANQSKDDESSFRQPGLAVIGSIARSPKRRPPKGVEETLSIRLKKAEINYTLIPELDQHTIPGTRNLSKPVTDLDQLYCQGRVAHLLLLRKCQLLADQCRGMFRANTPEGFAMWSEAANEPMLRAQVCWASVKNPKRTVEKILRMYKGDVSMVTDIARQDIIFETIADLEHCFEAIKDDPELEIVRTKNKLDVDYHDEMRNGYRVLHLNVRIMSQDARLLGVETHICELQLLPLAISRIKKHDGHRRYVQHRNLMGQ